MSYKDATMCPCGWYGTPWERGAVVSRHAVDRLPHPSRHDSADCPSGADALIFIVGRALARRPADGRSPGCSTFLVLLLRHVRATVSLAGGGGAAIRPGVP